VALTAAAFDSEATALDITRGRIIEMAAVPLLRGTLQPEAAYSTYVAAGVNIPAESTRIHGITDEKLLGAPPFKAAWQALSSRVFGHVLLGYSIDFDLALLEQEHARASIPWKSPDTLDVRALVAILNPTLPDQALETVAGWLGLPVKDRHTALGDAVLTGQVFLALVPHLREIGIRTLGEARLACERQADRASGPLVVRDKQAARTDALARTDSFPYRHVVQSLMSVPPLLLPHTATAGEALAMMVERKVSSLFVRGPKATGIVTERDMLRALQTRRGKFFAAPLAELASFPLRTVRTTDRIYVALGRMRRDRIRHLGVMDEAGHLVGALSQRDLLRQRADEALALSGAMDEAASIPELASVWRKLAEAARALLAEDVDARDIAAIISGEVCALTARAARMAEAGLPPPPKAMRFAVMVLGSGGRGESLLALDQDNAIVFEAEDDAAANDWLAQLGQRMNAILNEVGVPLCKGGVMAGNAAWRRSATNWRQQVAHWLAHTDPQGILSADIFFDALPVHGDEALAETLRDDAIAAASRSEAFLKLMSLNAASSHKVTNWLGQLAVEEDGRIDLKKNGIMPIFSTARILSLRHVIHARATRDRLGALRGNPTVPQTALEAIQEAHGELLAIILRQQLDDIATGVPPTSRVNPKDLSARERDKLKWALKQVQSVPDLLGTPV
jgi:DNA polymerase-3 subunit epsilon/CBS domain-containing protein